MSAPEKLPLSIRLPTPARALKEHRLGAPREYPAPACAFDRVALAAAHVVAEPLSKGNPWLETEIDWDATIAYRRYLWSLGLGVAEAMDTAQRGMGLDWPASLELIGRSIEAAKAEKEALLFCGAGTDHLPSASARGIDDVIRAYEEQVAAIERLGGRIVIMASRALAAMARGPDDFFRVYDRVLSQVREPVIIHWLGEMFDPALQGYWLGGEARDGGRADPLRAMQACLAVVEANAAKVDGIKISLLDKHKEIDLRRKLPRGVRMYTGDDFNYPELIEGDGERHSDALLGIFDAIAPAASAALGQLAAGDRVRFHDILAATVPLSRHIFSAPTRFYKTGLVFLAWLNGHQDHFVMVGGQQSARGIAHLSETFRLADAAGLLRDPELACRRMRHLLALHGIS